MTVLQGAFWISDRGYKRYLNADAGGIVRGAAPGPRGLDLLNSTAPRTQIWLIEEATDGKNFRFRNYETGTALDIKDQSSDEGAQIVVTGGNSDSQVWEVNWLEGSTLGGIYQIKNTLVSKVLDQTHHTGSPVFSWSPHGGTNQAWLIEPVLLPTLYWLTNLAVGLVLRVAESPNVSDNSNCGVALVPKEISARNQLWAFEYSSASECVIRSASHSQFVLDLSAQDLQTISARKYHGGPNQYWKVTDEDENCQIASLANVATNTLLATRKQPLSGDLALNALVVAIDGHTRWQIHLSPQAPLFWVTIQNFGTRAFLAQAGDGSIIASKGALHANDHTAQWRFIMIGKEPRYLIVNRATGFVLNHHARATSGVSVVAKDDNRNDVNNHWMLEGIGDTVVGIVNVGSNCALDHWAGKTIQAYEPGTDNNNRQWVVMPFYDSPPAFALVNLYTGRSIANSPNPDIGTVITTDDVNSFQSQWLFYHPVNEVQSDPDYVLRNKMSGNVLEYYRGTRVEAQDTSHSDPHQKWKLLPLRERLFALINVSTQQFLYDPGEYNPITDEFLPDERVLCWHLVSYRESGFDFVSLDFDILQRLIPYMPPQPAERLHQIITHRLAAGEKITKGRDKTIHIPHAASITRIANATLRAVFTRLIEQWAEDSIPKTSQPYTIVSMNGRGVEEQWGISLGERSLRHRLGESGWARISLQGIYSVDGSQLANIQGQWLEAPMFQVIVPAGLRVGRAKIRRAMLQSLSEGLTVAVRATPTKHTPVARVGKHLSTTPRPPGPGAGDGRINSLALALGTIPIDSLKHEEL